MSIEEHCLVIDKVVTCCMQREGILRLLLLRLPKLLAFSVEGRLRPAVSTLMDMGLSQADIARKDCAAAAAALLQA